MTIQKNYYGDYITLLSKYIGLVIVKITGNNGDVFESLKIVFGDGVKTQPKRLLAAIDLLDSNNLTEYHSYLEEFRNYVLDNGLTLKDIVFGPDGFKLDMDESDYYISENKYGNLLVNYIYFIASNWEFPGAMRIYKSSLAHDFQNNIKLVRNCLISLLDVEEPVLNDFNFEEVDEYYTTRVPLEMLWNYVDNIYRNGLD